jgi:hypothetical protein
MSVTSVESSLPLKQVCHPDCATALAKQKTGEEPYINYGKLFQMFATKEESQARCIERYYMQGLQRTTVQAKKQTNREE